jgi:hypothetical protein
LPRGPLDKGPKFPIRQRRPARSPDGFCVRLVLGLMLQQEG